MPSPASAGTIEQDRTTIIDTINTMRIAAGTCPFGYDEGVQAQSQAWSTSMASAGRLAHNVNRPRGAGASAENVAMSGDVVAVLELFKGSPRHFRNMMNPRYDRIGIGVENTGSGSWVTINFTASNPRGC